MYIANIKRIHTDITYALSQILQRYFRVGHLAYFDNIGFLFNIVGTVYMLSTLWDTDWFCKVKFCLQSLCDNLIIYISFNFEKCLQNNFVKSKVLLQKFSDAYKQDYCDKKGNFKWPTSASLTLTPCLLSRE